MGTSDTSTGDNGDNGEHTTTAAESLALTVFEAQANERTRKVWFNGQWWFSIIDVVGVLTESANPRKYWFDVKRRIQDEGFRELSSKCRQLKMRAADGKFRVTDAADRETLLRIIQSIPSPKAEPFKQWLAQVGAERLEEVEAVESSAAMERLRAQYRKKGYTDQWIERHIEKILRGLASYSAIHTRRVTLREQPGATSRRVQARPSSAQSIISSCGRSASANCKPRSSTRVMAPKKNRRPVQDGMFECVVV